MGVFELLDEHYKMQQGGTWEKQKAKVQKEKYQGNNLLEMLQEDRDLIERLSKKDRIKKETNIKTSDNTKTVTKNKPELTSKSARNKTDKEIAEERETKIQESIKYQDVPFTKDNWREVLAKETQSTGDKFRVSLEPNFFDDYLNPAVMIGDMASNLGQAPLQAQQSDSVLPYVTSIGTPLVVGATAGIGTQSTGQFVNNLANPLAGTGDLVNNLGNKYLPNTYKLNPFAFKASEDMGYRMLGKEGYQDAIESGVLRAKPVPNQPASGGISLTRNINRNPNTGKMQGALDRPYFADGFIDERYAADYMAAVNKADNNLVPIPTHKGIAPSQAGSIPLDNAIIYKKDWLQGYKQVEVPKPTSNFKSEINWSKWNKEIPENTQLMQEYNTIEQKAKANNTWMKNPDGSPFKGTPEQFVQQNSENFKKAFPHYHGEILNHNTNAELNTIDEYFFNKGAGDTGYYGKGTYTHPKKDYTKMYGKNNYEFYLNSKNKGFLDKSNIDDAEYFKRSDDEILQHHLPEYENKLMNYELDPSRYYDNAKENWLNKLNEQVKAGKISRDKLDEFTSLHNPKNGEVVIPFNNRVKSAIGNNGMFDMNNPNIYKSIVPLAGASYLATQGQEEPKKFQQGGKFTENEKKFLEEVSRLKLI